MVIVIISVVTALVAPSLFPTGASGLREETRHLQQLLRLAADETQMTGIPMRWWARRDRYGFEQLDEQRAWVPVTEAPFLVHQLHGVVIDRVMENGIDQTPEEKDAKTLMSFSGKEEQQRDDTPLIGRVRILPNGMITAADITLRDEGEPSLQRTLHLRPGPAGITESHDPGATP